MQQLDKVFLKPILGRYGIQRQKSKLMETFPVFP